MSLKLRASTFSIDSSQCRAQPIRADFINSKKLPARLDRLLGQGKYECHWQLNHYIIDGPRHLNDVSVRTQSPYELEKLLLTSFTDRGSRAKDVTPFPPQ